MPAFLYSSIACVRLKKIAIVVSPLVAIIEDHVCLLENVCFKSPCMLVRLARMHA